MAKNNETLTESGLVAQLYDLDRQIEALQAEKAEIEAHLIKLGDGKYVERDIDKRLAQVITPAAPKPTYSLFPESAKKAFLEAKGVEKSTPALDAEFAEAQVARAKKLAGAKFPQLFDRVVSYVPARGYADLIPRIFPTAEATATKLLDLCRVTKAAGKSYVRLLSKPKKAAAGAGESED